MTLRTIIKYLPEGSKEMLSLEPLVRRAIDEAVARQKALGLKNYYVDKKGRIYARLPNGRYASVNGPVK
jgi:hypothetical protein